MLKKGILCLIAAAALLFAAGCGEEQPAPEISVKEETITIQGLKGEYELLFITDTHVVVRDKHAEDAVIAYDEERYSMFHNAEGVDSQTQFRAYIDYANEQSVDAVLFGGDIIDSPSEAKVEWLSKQLKRLNMPYLYVPGNHDWTYPWEYMTETGRQSYLPLLEPMMQGNTELGSLDFGEFLVVGVNDSTNQVSEAVFPEFEAMYRAGKPMLVMTHVPFLAPSLLERAREVWSGDVVIGEEYNCIDPNEYSYHFMEMLTAADSPVELVLAGHVHFYNRDFI